MTDVANLLFRREGQTTRLIKPVTFSSSLWVHPPEPAILLSQNRFDPFVMYRPRVFLWLPHFLVEGLKCPNLGCGKILEKNGAIAPRLVTDVEDSFWIVTWQYYCRQGCKKVYRGWAKPLLNSLPAFIRLAFPAVLSRKQGVSQRLLTQLRVSNQHKMGKT
jgi:hypothetical protein